MADSAPLAPCSYKGLHSAPPAPCNTDATLAGPFARCDNAKALKRYDSFIDALGRRLVNGRKLRQKIGVDVNVHARDTES